MKSLLLLSLPRHAPAFGRSKYFGGSRFALIVDRANHVRSLILLFVAIADGAQPYSGGVNEVVVSKDKGGD
jgi:hypothetical protein